MPLENLLGPLIAKHAAELAQQVEPQTPIAKGYLQTLPPVGANVGQVAMPTDAERARVDADYRKRLVASRERANNPGESYDPRIQSPEMLGKIEAQRLQQHGTVIGRAVGRRLMQQSDPGIAPTIRPMPNAPVQPAPEAKPSRVIQVKPGEVTDEAGYAVDKKGKRLGYLDQEAMNPGTRYLDRRPSDLNLDATAGNIIRDKFFRDHIERTYGPHLRAMQDNRDPDGRPTDKLPDGYFEALGEERGKPFSKDERENILKGMKKLKEVQKLEATNTGMGLPIARV